MACTQDFIFVCALKRFFPDSLFFKFPSSGINVFSWLQNSSRLPGYVFPVSSQFDAYDDLSFYNCQRMDGGGVGKRTAGSVGGLVGGAAGRQTAGSMGRWVGGPALGCVGG